MVSSDDIHAVVNWAPGATPTQEIAFMPARILLQDFTGVPALVDLAAMRDAMKQMGGEPKKINPLQPAELVIDHSVQVDDYGKAAAFLINTEREFERNRLCGCGPVRAPVAPAFPLPYPKPGLSRDGESRPVEPPHVPA